MFLCVTAGCGVTAAVACATGSDAGALHLGSTSSGATSSTSGVGAGGAGTSSGTGMGGVPGSSSSGGTGASSTGGASTGGSSTTASSSGAGGGASSSASSSGTGGGASSSSSTSSGALACSIGHLVISQIRSRGAGGGSDEFIELWNATPSPVALDTSWTVDARSSTSTSYTSRWTGSGKSVPAWGHFLLGGSAYTQTPVDGSESGVTDASSVRLLHGTTVIDSVCYYSGSNPFDASYTCEGTPVVNPHDNSASTDVDASIVRKPGGAVGNCTDTNVNAADFATQTPATPENVASAPTP
jgi:hypothetical protein